MSLTGDVAARWSPWSQGFKESLLPPDPSCPRADAHQNAIQQDTLGRNGLDQSIGMNMDRKAPTARPAKGESDRPPAVIHNVLSHAPDPGIRAWAIRRTRRIRSSIVAASRDTPI